MKQWLLLLLLISQCLFAGEREFNSFFNHIETDRSVVALTFDDGPHPMYTSEILEILKKHDVKATFFVIGYNVRLYPELVKKIKSDGHEIANHSYSHEAYSQMNDEDVLVDLARSQKELKNILGEYPSYFRPPYGRLKSSQVNLVSPYFKKIVTWSLDPKDWEENAKSGTILVTILKEIKPGDIVLLHSDKSETVNMLPALLENLLHRGMQFATISDLIDAEQ